MKTKLIHIFILAVVLFGLFIPTQTPQAQAKPGETASSNEISPEELLNPDGTLSLDGSFNGALDLSGYSVAMDPLRGPVFGAEESMLSVPSDEWDNIGDGSGALRGTVYAVAVIGTDVYVGGDFTDANNNPAADYIAKWDTLAGNWSALGAQLNGNGALSGARVYALAVSGTDLYVGGLISNVYNGGTYLPTAKNIVKWDTLTGNWSALGSDGAGSGSINSHVYAIAVSGSNVYVGGAFTDVNNGGTVLTAADKVAKWDGSNWSALGSDGASGGSLNGDVRSVVVNGGNVYAGGYFTNVNNGGTLLTAADYIAKWDGANWSALGSNGASNGSLGQGVRALAFSGTDLYVGGSFSNVNNGGSVLSAADYIAKWDGANWSAVGSNGAGDGTLSSTVTSLLVVGSNVYAGGDFTNVNNGGAVLGEADYIAKWDGANWSALGSNGAGDGSLPVVAGNLAWAIGASGSNVFAGGFFHSVNNGGTVLDSAEMVVQFDGTDWSTLGADSNGSLNANVLAVTVSGTDVYVGGYFTDVDNHGVNLTAADYVAKWDGADWSALGSNGAGGGSLTSFVSSIVVNGTDVYVGGNFANVNNGGVSLGAADKVAKWDGSNWSALGSDGAGNGSLNNYVGALALSGTDVYVSGSFTDVNNGGTVLGAADYLAKWDTLTGNWSAVGSDGAGDGSLNNSVFVITVNNMDVYVGGYFTNVNNNGAVLGAADYIAKWDALTGDWSALGSNGAGDGSLPAGSYVLAIVVNATDVYAGGYFTNVNNSGTVLGAADNIAKWDTLTGNWSALGSNGAGDGAIWSGDVRAIVVNGTDVYAGGALYDVKNASNVLLSEADHVVRFDGAQWLPLSGNGSGNGALNYWVQDMVVSGDDLLVAGNFTNVSNNGATIKEADYLAAYGMPTAPDLTPPTVVSVTRADSNPTASTSVDFTVTFSESVTGVDGSDLIITAAGISGASITSIVPFAGATRTVTVNTGSGNGTLRLDINDDDSIEDLSGNKLGGTGTGNGSFASGESYTVNKTVILTVKSNGVNDGWILESTETSGAGGSMNSAATNFYLGDNAAKKQYRAILSFNTSPLPDNANITKVTLKFKKQRIAGGGNPIIMFQGFMADVKKGMFGTAPLALGDFKATASKTVGPQSPALVSGWYSLNLTPGKSFINKLATSGGLTQIRLRFKLDDNNNAIANYLKIYSGNAGAANRPQLIVEYYTP